MEITNHWIPNRSSRQLPSRPVGQITSTTQHASQSIEVLKCQPKGLLMDRPSWRTRFQEAPIGTPWRGDPNVRKLQQKNNVGREKQARLLCPSIIGTLPLLLGFDERD